MVSPSDPDDDLVAALQRLPREVEPPPQVRRALNERLNAGPNDRMNDRRSLWRAAVAASLVLAAFAAGRVTAPRQSSPAAQGQEFAFLLYGGPVGGGDDRAAEYGAWVVEARRQGRQVTGERLADAAWMAGVPMPEPGQVRGFFLIRATDAAEALDLARRHPHARDGTIVVRPIDTP